MLNFDNPLSNVSIINSVFFGNLADMVGCLYAYQYQGIVHLFNNSFINNSAITFRRHGIGSSSAITISGLFAKIDSYYNTFYQNFAEYAGTIGIYYGHFNDYNSQFIGIEYNIHIAFYS